MPNGVSPYLEILGELRNNNVVKKREDKTRDLVARSILENGPATAATLARRLKITQAGIRRHLDGLVNDGILTSRDPYQRSSTLRGRGRPSKVFVITDTGRKKFENSYDDLAVSVLQFMARNGNRAEIVEFAKSRAREIAKNAKPKIDGKKSLSDKSKALSIVLTDSGYSANLHSQGIGDELCQNNCPIAHVASQFPELCEAETEIFSELLGTHVQRLATIGRGDGVCTTFIPNPKTSTRRG
jgi:predicted ArsR family transcriptional regulator